MLCILFFLLYLDSPHTAMDLPFCFFIHIAAAVDVVDHHSTTPFFLI